MEISGLEQTSPCLDFIHSWHDFFSPHGVLHLQEELISPQIFSLRGRQSQRFAGKNSGVLYSSLLLLSSPDF